MPRSGSRVRVSSPAQRKKKSWSDGDRDFFCLASKAFLNEGDERMRMRVRMRVGMRVRMRVGMRVRMRVRMRVGMRE